MYKESVRFGIAAVLFFSASGLNASELKPETLTAWQAYIQMAEERMQARLGDGRTFLWSGDDPDLMKRLKAGEIEVGPVSGRGSQGAPHGLIHDWMGAVFIPHTSVADLMSFVRDYQHYKEVYKPAVVDSKLIQRVDDEEDRFSMRWLQKVSFVTAAMDAQYQSRTVRVNDRCFYAISRSTNIQEIQNYGHPDERQLPAGQGNGFIWRLYSIARYEERDGGVYVELEAIGLTRDIPAALRFAVKPLVTRLSRNSILVSLTQTRDALHAASEVSHRGNPLAQQVLAR